MNATRPSLNTRISNLLKLGFKAHFYIFEGKMENLSFSYYTSNFKETVGEVSFTDYPTCDQVQFYNKNDVSYGDYIPSEIIAKDDPIREALKDFYIEFNETTWDITSKDEANFFSMVRGVNGEWSYFPTWENVEKSCKYLTQANEDIEIALLRAN